MNQRTLIGGILNAIATPDLSTLHAYRVYMCDIDHAPVKYCTLLFAYASGKGGGAKFIGTIPVLAKQTKILRCLIGEISKMPAVFSTPC